jgi:hypothetical protein
MNKSTKLILTAGLLALAACSGKGGAGTSFDDSELWPSKQQNTGNGGQQLGNTAPCNVTVKAGNSTLHFCGEIETSYCTQGGGSVVSACDPDYAQTCAVGGYTIYAYESSVSCSEIQSGYNEWKSKQTSSSPSTNPSSSEQPSQSSSGSSISDLCGAGMYQELDCNSGKWYICATDYKYYSCASDGSSCKASDMNTWMSSCTSYNMDDLYNDDVVYPEYPSDDYYTYY